MKLGSLKKQFAAKGLHYPPNRLYIRAFKHEKQLELWVADKPQGPLKLLRTYEIARASGVLGPKRKEGDRQVPEGFYTIDRYNPRSQFLLSLGLNYPNARDRALGEKHPGGDIFIHGSNVSIGCLAMTDDRIREIYLISLDARAKPVPVHIFPMRMQGAQFQKILAEAAPETQKLWQSMAPAYRAFQGSQTVPRVGVSGTSYILRD